MATRWYVTEEAIIGKDTGMNLDLSVVRTGSGANGGWTYKETDDRSAVWYEHSYEDANGNTSYLTFGTWMDNGVPSLFRSYSHRPDANAIRSVTGTATYEGRSAGYYQDSSRSNNVYRTTSDVSITANFNDDTVRGVLDNFLIEGSPVDSGNWELTLESAAIRLDNTIPANNGIVAGDVSGTVDGSYTAKLVYVSAATANEFGIVGDYRGTSGSLRLEGSLGAK